MKQNNTKRLWTTFIIAAFICSWTKSSYAQPVFGVQAGVNVSSIRTTDAEGGKSSSDLFPGLRVGLTADIPIALHWSVSPAIFYSQRGFREKTGGYNGSAENFKVRANYVELPVNFLYKPDVGNLNLFVGAGFTEHTEPEATGRLTTNCFSTISASHPKETSFSVMINSRAEVWELLFTANRLTTAQISL